MNYIRTEDGIYEVIDETKYSYISIYGKYISKDDVIEDGNTIEELCDGFYVDNKRDFLTSRVFQTFSELKYEFEYYKAKNKKATFYGFIKTDKGLIYVAKMNDKGVLELL